MSETIDVFSVWLSNKTSYFSYECLDIFVDQLIYLHLNKLNRNI